MKPWTKKEKRWALTLSSFAIFIAVTAAFAGFTGFKSVNVIACMLGLSFTGLCIVAVGWLAKLFSKEPLWTKVYKTGWMLAIAPLVYVVFEIANPIL